jgi:hypothetical protein
MYNCETDIRVAEWRRFSRDIVFGCPQRSPFRVIVDPIVARVAISAASWKKQRASVALSGRVPWRRTPGLKPWAVLLDHFMVKNWHHPKTLALELRQLMDASYSSFVFNLRLSALICG